MEEFGPAKPVFENISLIETKNYPLNLGQDAYTLTIETYTDGKINFKLRQNNSASLLYYYKEYTFDEIIQNLLLFKNVYENISKVFSLIKEIISNKKIYLSKNKSQKKMKIIIKKPMEFDEVECYLELDEKKMKIEDFLTEQMDKLQIKMNLQHAIINNIKEKIYLVNKDKEEMETKINLLIEEKKKDKKEMETKINLLLEEKNKEKKEMETKINLLTEEKNKEKKEMEIKINLLLEEKNKDKKEMETKINLLLEEKNNEKKEMETKINELIEENKKLNKNFENYLFNKQNNLNDNQSSSSTMLQKQPSINKSNPNYLKFTRLLTNNHSSGGILSNFEVFIGLKDKIEYLAYGNKINNNIEILRIYDNMLIHSLPRHNNKITVIKYYNIIKNKKEYLISCDLNSLVVIWDIQDNYTIKNHIQEQFQKMISDALLLFTNKNYILLSSASKVPIKLYELQENSSLFIKDINGTNENITNYMIPWFYNNKYYIIKLHNDISVYNIFENECYTELKSNNSKYYCGFIINNYYLCANDKNNKLLRIWDLVNKNIFKEIIYDGDFGKEIIPWNNIYIIVACKECFIVIDLEKGITTNKIMIINSCLGGIKKIVLSKFGECLVAADFNNNIGLFSLRN